MNKILFELLLMVFVGALIGWFTNYLAIKLLFRPYNEINFILFRIQGLIPKKRAEIAENIAKTVEKELISMADITEKIKNAEISLEDIKDILDKLDNEEMKRKILGDNPFILGMVSNSVIDKAKDQIAKILYKNKNEIIEKIAEAAEGKIDFKEIMLEKMENFSLEQIEEIILSVSKNELKHIEIIGGILGGIIGAIQFVLVNFLARIQI